MSIVSIQSHVAYGHVGNAAAVFALQRLGHEVWPLHLLQYSNHPGYGDHAGTVLGAADLIAVVEAMSRRGAFAGADALLSGYLPIAASAEVVARALEALRAESAGALYCCDPVIGDVETGAYVPQAVADAVARSLVPRADIVTPNVFELGLLTECTPDGRDEVLAAARRLRATGPDLVLITSVPGAPGRLDTLLVGADDAWCVTTPLLDLGRRPDGAGDLICALFLGAYLHSRDPRGALEHAVRGTHDVLAATGDADSRELTLIAAQDRLVHPRSVFEARALDRWSGRALGAS